MALKELVKYTIGKEATAGTAVSRTAVLPIRDIGSLDRAITKKEDPLIAGLGMASGEYAVSGDVKGSIPLSPRGCKGFGHVLKGTFGAESTPAEIVGVIRLKYKGDEESCKLVADLSTKTLKAYIGALGSEALDANFGDAGTIDLTASGYDTLAELVAAIDGLDDYEAFLVTGTASNLIVSIVDGTFQAKGKFTFLFLTGTGSGAYLHRFTPDLTLDSERPTYSVQKDGFQKNYLYDGVVFNTLSLSGEQKSEIEADVDVLGMKETSEDIEASELPVPREKPYTFAGGLTSLGGNRYSAVRKSSLKFENGHTEDGYGQADDSIDRTYQQKGKFAVSGELTLRLDATSVQERAKAESGEIVAFQFLFFEVEHQFKLGVRGLMLAEIPYGEISETPSAEANGDALDLGIKFKGFKPGLATDYEEPVTVSVLTADADVY
jgi:hypothetical protein